VDFARAAVTLGVDRGIGAFQRYGFQVRNGLAYFATPLTRVVVRRNARADLLSDIDQWHGRLRQKAGSQANPAAPASIAHGLDRLERAVLDLCRDGSADSLQAVIISLGRAEQALSRSLKWSSDNVRPLGGLRHEWLKDAETNSAEFRLAAALAGMRARPPHARDFLWLRQMLEPVKEDSLRGRWPDWDKTLGNDVVWHDGNLTDALNDMLTRRIIRFGKAGVEGWPDWSPRFARLEDITAFIEGRTDDNLLADLLWGLSLINWQDPQLQEIESSRPNRIRYDWKTDDDHRLVPSSFYALLKLCFQPKRNGLAIPLIPAIHNRARSGHGEEASELAVRRLRGSGYAPLVRELSVASDTARRTAAALLFPISPRDLSLLEQIMINQPESQNA
jgi:CRISPR-associated protein Csx17